MKKTAFLGMAVALALIISYVETLIPFSVGIPGIKLGLTNIVIVVLLYCMDWKSALTVSVLRILLAGFLFGSLASILYSLAGGILSLFCMALLKKNGKFSVTGISIAGGAAHNIGQITAAFLVVENLNLFYYLPVLLLSGVLTGMAVGITAGEICKRIARQKQILS